MSACLTHLLALLHMLQQAKNSNLYVSVTCAGR